MDEQVVTFKVVRTRDEDGLHFEVNPSLTNILRSNGGEDIIAAVASNCIFMLAKRNGLEGAIERVTQATVSRTRPMP